MATQQMSREEKNQRCKQRNANRKAVKREQAELRNAGWQKLSVQQQLETLKSRQGGCNKQFNKILAKSDLEQFCKDNNIVLKK